MSSGRARCVVARAGSASPRRSIATARSASAPHGTFGRSRRPGGARPAHSREGSSSRRGRSADRSSARPAAGRPGPARRTAGSRWRDRRSRSSSRGCAATRRRRDTPRTRHARPAGSSRRGRPCRRPAGPRWPARPWHGRPIASNTKSGPPSVRSRSASIVVARVVRGEELSVAPTPIAAVSLAGTRSMRHDPRRAGHDGAHDARQPDAAEPDDRHRRAGRHGRGLEHGARRRSSRSSR